MRLNVDCGNTHVDLGMFCGEKGNMSRRWRFRSFGSRNSEEHGVLFRHFLSTCGVEKVDTVTVSCVCPQLLEPIMIGFREALGLQPFLVTSALIDAPPEAGGDRVANAISVMHFHKCPAVVVDFGTATAFDLVSSRGLESCVITQGIDLFVKGQNSIAEHLPPVSLPPEPQNGMCRDTVSSMGEGLYQGYRGMVCGIISSMEENLPDPVTIISTGGGWEKVRCVMEGVFHQHDLNLTLKGIDVAGFMLREK